MKSTKRRHLPLLNTTATADISFMLLIFFLMTSSFDSDRQLPRRLSPQADSALQQRETVVLPRNLMEIRLEADGSILVDDVPSSREELLQSACRHISASDLSADAPEKTVREVSFYGSTAVADRHIFLLHISPEATYEAYFLLQNTLAAAYARERNRTAKRQFGRPYAQLSAEQREATDVVVPQRISEQPLTETP